MDIAKQTATPAKVTHFKVSKKDGFGSLLLFSIYAKLKKSVVYLDSDLGSFVQKLSKAAKCLT